MHKDKVCIGLTKYYERHAKEESGHDDWLLEDLESIGVRRGTALSRRPIQPVAELVGSQYYWIQHWHPVSLLGYIAVMEGYPPERSFLDGLAARTKYPKTAFRTLAKHSYLDLGHRRELYDAMDALPLERKHEEWVTLNAVYSMGKWREVARTIGRTI